MPQEERIVLAHQSEFALGRLTVSPARRELVRDDGCREVVENRVMQVLVALAKADGGILTRDELIQSCWDGRVVGEDAINRVMSRLRRVASGIGAGSFGVETVTRIGYRLAKAGSADDMPAAPTSDLPPAQLNAVQPRLGRRALLAGTVAVLGLAGGALLYRRASGPAVPREVRLLMTQAEITREQIGLDSANETIAIYQRVLRMAPGYADAWGMMGFSYGIYSHYRERQVGEAMRARAEAAGRRALEIDPDNPFGELALSVALPFIGHWREKERRLRRALSIQPDNDHVLFALGYLMTLVGRINEAAHYYERIKRRPLTPVTYADYLSALWSSGRWEETDRAMADAASLYPSHPMVWFNRFDILLFSGRPTAAMAMARDRLSRPQGLTEAGAEKLMELARVIDQRSSAEVEALMSSMLDAVMRGTGGNFESSQRVIMAASALGRIDDAFAVADAYYFSRGSIAAGGAFENQHWPAPDQRHTAFLFSPVMRPTRADLRFNRLVQELGLERYWRESGTRPDYRRGTD